MVSKILIATLAILAVVTTNVSAQEEDSKTHRIHMEHTKGGLGLMKYEHLIDKSHNFRSTDPHTWYEHAYQFVFGKTPVQKKFDADAARFFKKHTEYGPGHLGSRESVGLMTELGTMWVGPVLMGRQQLQMNVVYDTGSDWLVIFGDDCQNCNGTKFDNTDSIPTTSRTSERLYGSAALTGREYRNEVCISFRACVREFEYFSISTQKGLNPPIEGILGMSQNYSAAMGGKAFVDPGPLLVEHLVRERRIEVPTFSFYMKTMDMGRSHVDFGWPDKFNMRGEDPEKIAKIPMLRDFFWAQYLQSISFGDPKVGANAYRLPEEKYAILDTGSSHLFIPTNYFNTFLQKMVEQSGAEYQTQQGFAIATCNARWKSLWFQFDNYWIEITPDEYLLDISDNQDRSVCHILMIGNNYDFFLYGLPLFQGYYTIHDMWNLHIGYIPHHESRKDFVRKAPVPDQVLEIIVPNYQLQLLAILVLGAAYLGYAIIEPAAHDEYGRGTISYYSLMTGYTICAIICVFIVYYIASAIFFQKPEQPNEDYDAQNVPEGNGYDEEGYEEDGEYEKLIKSFQMLFMCAGVVFFYKYMALKKAVAKPAAEGKQDLMLSNTANGMI